MYVEDASPHSNAEVFILKLNQSTETFLFYIFSLFKMQIYFEKPPHSSIEIPEISPDKMTENKCFISHKKVEARYQFLLDLRFCLN